jgi:hypothetical protein
MSTDVARYEPAPIAIAHERSIEELLAQANKIKQAMEQAMEVDQHYGIIPGARKPSLWKPGAEKLCLLFRLDPQYHSEPVAPDAGGGGHLTVKSVCTLWHIPTGQRFGSGEASCSTRESKYAYRQAGRKCPVCGKEAIIRGKAEWGGGWLCFKKREGCGAKFKEGDTAIESQETGRVANEDLADSYNTVLKMANKRALVAGILNVTAASDVFTQDLEDFAREEADEPPAPVRKAPARRAPAPTPATEDEGAVEAALNEELERSVLLARVKGAADKLGWKADKRAAAWDEYCQGMDRAGLCSRRSTISCAPRRAEEMTRAKDAGHAVAVMTRDGSTQCYPDAAFSVDETGALQVWRVDGTQVIVYAPGQWSCVKATGSGLGPGS